jgi:ABC-type nitrate/sulfonate/bicarbonate transport system substrate-binding protein
MVFTKDEFIRDHRDAVQAFCNGIAKGIVWMEENTPEKMAEVFAPMSGRDMKTQLQTINEVYPTLSHTGYLPRDGHEAANRLSLSCGYITKPVAFESVADNSFMEQAWKNLGLSS